MGRRPIREEKGDAREPGSPKTCRKGRSPGWAEAQAGNSLHRTTRFPVGVYEGIEPAVAWMDAPQAGNSLHRTTRFPVGVYEGIEPAVAWMAAPQAGNSLHRHHSFVLAIMGESIRRPFPSLTW